MGKAQVSWRHLMLAPLLFAFLRCGVLSPKLANDMGADPDNPILFFAGVLAGALACGLACAAWPTARRTLRQAPLAGWLLALLAGAGATCAHIVAGVGPIALLAAGGAALGVAGVGMLLRWCAAYAALPHLARVRTAALSCLVAYVLDMLCTPVAEGAAASLATVFGAAFLSALPLEGLGRDGGLSAGTNPSATTAAAREKDKAEERPSGGQARTLLGKGWPVVAGAFVAYLISGFSWGNALHGVMDYLSGTSAWVSGLGKCAGAMVVFLLAARKTPPLLSDWLLGGAVGLLQASWLVGGVGAQGVDLMTGVAFGVVDAVLLAWACGSSLPCAQAGGERPAGEDLRPAFAIVSVAGAVAVGLALSPLLSGLAATVVAPLCDTAFLVVLVATAPGRARRDTSDRAATDQQVDLSARAQAAALSPRETDVFLLLAQGHSSGYIAQALGVSDHTVKTHVKHIYTKMGVHSKDEFLSAVKAPIE